MRCAQPRSRRRRSAAAAVASSRRPKVAQPTPAPTSRRSLHRDADARTPSPSGRPRRAADRPPSGVDAELPLAGARPRHRGLRPEAERQQNDGINVAVPEGTPIKAAEDGVVAYAGNELKGYGNLVLVRHANGYVTAYAHASEMMVKRGDTDQARPGDRASPARPATSTAPQLHFEIRKGATPVDPMQFLTAAKARANNELDRIPA